MSINQAKYLSISKIAKKYDLSTGYFRNLIKSNKIIYDKHYIKICDAEYKLHIENIHKFLIGKESEKVEVCDINKYLLNN